MKVPVQDLLDNVQTQYPKALGVNWDSARDTMSTSLTFQIHQAWNHFSRRQNFRRSGMVGPLHRCCKAYVSTGVGREARVGHTLA